MKKNLEKIFASCSIVVAIILIMILLVTAFGGIDAEEFDSKLVRGLLITLAILYVALSVVSLVLIFINSDVVKEITIRQDKGGIARVSVGVITKLVKNTCKEIEGVKCQKVALVNNEYGVRLKLNVKVVDKDVVEAETYIRTLLEDVFEGEFGFRFSSIEIKVTALIPKYKADHEVVQTKVDERLAQIKAESADACEENPALVQSESVEECVQEVEEVQDVVEAQEESEQEEQEVEDIDIQSQELEIEKDEEIVDEQNDVEGIEE